MSQKGDGPTTITSPPIRGRTDSFQKVLDAFSDAKRDDTRSKVVVVSGPAGCGKTALIRHLVEVEKCHKMTWKFDSQTLLRVAPGFREASWRLSEAIMMQSEDDLQVLRKKIRDTFDDSQIAMLGRFVPHLSPILDKTNLEEQAYGFDHTVMRSFVKVACNENFPIVYHLEDTQWIDEWSLDFAVDSIPGNTQRGALHVVSYNSDLVDESSAWYLKLQKLCQLKTVDVTTINLQNLSQEDSNALVAEMLPCSIVQDCKEVASFIFEATCGNPLYMKELLSDLSRTESLYLEGDKWRMADRINLHLGSDVGDYYARNILTLPQSLRECLEVAACLGMRLDPVLLRSLNPLHGASINTAINMELIAEHPTKLGKPSMKFRNNSFHAAILRLVKDREKTHYSIGKSLLLRLTEEELENNLLVVTGQLMMGATAITKKTDKLEIAQLALRAARVAVHFTSFLSARKCLSFGLSLLDKRTCWRGEEYELSLALHNAAAEVAYASGRGDLVEGIVAPVLQHGRTFDHKLQANSTLLHSFVSLDRLREATSLSLQLLAELGETFPKRPNRLHIAVEFIKTRRMLKGRTVESLRRYRTVSDRSKAAALQILDTTFSAFFIKLPLLAPLASMRMVQISLKNGFNNHTSVGFGTYGMLLCCFLGKIEEGTMYGELSLKLLDRFKAKEFIPRVFVAVYGYIFPWTKPIAFDQLLRAYRVGLETGDIEFAMVNVSLYIFYSFNSTKPLEEIERERALYLREMEAYDQRTALRLHIPSSLMVRQLMGDDTVVVAVPKVDDEGFRWAQSQEMTVAFVFGRYEEAVKISDSGKIVIPFDTVDVSSHYLFEGLSNVAYYKTTKRERLRRIWKARSSERILKKMAAMSPNYCLGKLKLLQAEIDSLSISRRKQQRANQRFLLAVSFAQSSGCLFDEALSRERYGRFLCDACDSSAGMAQLQLACSVYRTWHAYRKARLLQDEWQSLSSRS